MHTADPLGTAVFLLVVEMKVKVVVCLKTKKEGVGVAYVDTYIHPSVGVIPLRLISPPDSMEVLLQLHEVPVLLPARRVGLLMLLS